MNKNTTQRFIKGYDLAIFKVNNNALHITISNQESVKSILQHPLTFSTILKEMQKLHETSFGIKATNISIRENRKHNAPHINQILLIIK